MDVPLPLVTPRLTLRPYESGDLDALHDLFGREDVVRYVPWEPMGLDRARELLERRLRQTRIDADGDGIVLAAVETETGAMVGEFGLWVSSLEHRQGVVGWAIHPDRQGRGLATEGAEELLRVGFEVLDMHRIIADSDPRNTPSLRVMERVGMRREAELIEKAFIKGEWITEVVYAILAADWRSMHGSAGSF